MSADCRYSAVQNRLQFGCSHSFDSKTMWRLPIVISLFSFLWLGTSGCGEGANQASADKLLARVHNKTLYLSELDGLFPQFATAEDSLLVIRAFTSRWVRDAVLLHAAEQNVPRGLNIDSPYL